MMGIKERDFAALPKNLALEELVPQGNFYRRLEELDLSFVRELVRPLYASGGRPSVDPVAFFEGIHSEGRLMEVAADSLSVRWYWATTSSSPCPTTPASRASGSATAFRSSAASSRRSSSGASSGAGAGRGGVLRRTKTNSGPAITPQARRVFVFTAPFLLGHNDRPLTGRSPAQREQPPLQHLR
jgi:hypothetical protein